MKQNTKKILLLGIGITFLFAMAIVPLGIAVAFRPTLLPDIGPGAGIPAIDSADLYSEVDNGFLGWEGSLSGGVEYSIEPE